MNGGHIHGDPEARIEAARAQLLSETVPWDELRERRVLGGIETAIAQRRATPARRPIRVIALAAAAVVTLAAAVVLAFVLPRATEGGAAVGTIAIEDTPRATLGDVPAIPYATVPTMALADGSVAQLHDGARVDVGVQTDGLVRLDQRSGTVRYEVAPNPARSFVVDAGGVQVRVIGTIFTVRYAGDTHIEVAVERGLVEVSGASRVAQLGAGDSLELEIEPDEYLIIEDDAGDPPAEERRRRGKGPTTKPESGPTLDALLAESDAARAAGDLPRAATALQELVARFPRDSQAVTAYFQLGKVQRRRGKHAAAAAAFAACWNKAPRGTLAEDARAEAADSWLAAGRSADAEQAAGSYLDRYPNGTHAARMQRILQRAE